MKSVALYALLAPGLAIAQAAGAGADFNRKDRDATEVQRLKNYDKPVQKDAFGNAIISGGVSGVIKGSVAKGATSVATGTVVNTAKQQVPQDPFRRPKKIEMKERPDEAPTFGGSSKGSAQQ